MAEAAVTFALKSLRSLLADEINLLGSAKKEVQDITHELEIIKSFLKDADTRAAQEEEEEGGGNEGVKTWVNQVRKEAYRIEDAIDDYKLKKANLPHGTGHIAGLRKISCFIKKLKLLHKTATEIKEINSLLANIQQRGQRYGFRSIYDERARNATPHDSRVGSFFIEDTEVVGIEPTRDKFIDWLVNGTLERSVIAVMGEGGLGKTTLAGKIFNNEFVRKHFDCQAWITVGKEYNKKDLLSTIIKEFYRLIGYTSGEIDKMEERDLITTLREHLKDKCYMVLFDDVWKIKFWGDVEHALLDNNKSSRIMVTTRNRGVADFFKQSSFVHIHELKPLAPNEAWKLFCRKTFRFSTIDGCCPPELKDLSKKILAKCGGLPLAIVAIGGLLSTKKKDVFEWQKLLDDLGSKLGSDPHLKSCHSVLSEGYYDLPHHLKTCLLYFGLFPEGYSITCGRLIRLWIAEGFVQYNKCSFEKVAKEYLTELIDRSLVQVSHRKISGRARKCRVHDLMHEIILKKTKELGFCRVLNGDDLSHISETRRISAYKSVDCFLENIKDSKIRSVLIFDTDNLPNAFMTTFVVNFRLLKVLDFEDSSLDYLPEEVGKLFHLHYLSVKNTKVEILPKSIGKLLNLETLDLRYSFVSKLPPEIRNLKKLRYLLVCRSDHNSSFRFAVEIQEGFGSLLDLQKLDYVQANSGSLKELRKLRQLRKLGISVRSKEEVMDVFASIESMKNLEFLIVKSASEEEIFNIGSMASPPQSLQTFCFIGNIKKLPDWIFELQNLIRIRIWLPGSVVDPLKVLHTLPRLLFLRLIGKDCDDEQLHFEEHWFPKLQELQLYKVKGLKLMIIDKGAMPDLRELVIGPCPMLKEIPTGIEHLRNLKTLLFVDMVKEIYYIIKNKNWEKVAQHIPEVRVTYKEAYDKELLLRYSICIISSPEKFEQIIEEQQGRCKEQSRL